MVLATSSLVVGAPGVIACCWIPSVRGSDDVMAAA